MPQFRKKEINGLVRTFNLYCRFPENRWNQIRKAEEVSKEGDKIFAELSKEFVDKYWSGNASFAQDAAENDPHAPLTS